MNLQNKISVSVIIIVKGKNNQSGSVVENLPANVGDVTSIPGSGRSPGEASRSSILASRIPWTEEPGGLVHRVAKSWSDMTEATEHKNA